jgi:hypothetical protein
MMSDPAEVDLLRERDRAKYGDPSGPTFEILLERLMGSGVDEESAYEAIIEGAYRTDREWNQRLDTGDER